VFNPNIHSYDSNTATVSVNGSTLNSLEYRWTERRIPDRLSAYTPGTEFIGQYRVRRLATTRRRTLSGGFVNVSLQSGTNRFSWSRVLVVPEPDSDTNYWHLARCSCKKAAVWLRGARDGGPIIQVTVVLLTGYEPASARRMFRP